MKKEAIQQVKNLLQSDSKIIIVAHRNPDGDAVGSTLGLYFYLKELEYNVTVLLPNDFPDFLKWIPGVDTIKIHDKDKTKGDALIAEADIIFTLDFNTLNRVGEVMQPALEASKADFIMIDHHQKPDDYATVMFSNTAMSSTCELAFHFIKAMNPEFKITPEIATSLYTGIMTDTGSFRFSTTTPTTHRVIAELIESGAPNTSIHEQVFDSNTKSRMKLLGTALNNLTILPEYRTAFITLTQKELDDHEFKKGDTEGFVNYGLSIQGVVFAAIFIENEQEKITKISLRSKGDFAVNELSEKHFHGGGHKNAAGGKSNLSLDETVKYFISILPSYQEALNHVF